MNKYCLNQNNYKDIDSIVNMTYRISAIVLIVN